MDLGHAKLSQYSKVCSWLEFFEMPCVKVSFLPLNFCLIPSFPGRTLLAFTHIADRDSVDKDGADVEEAMG